MTDKKQHVYIIGSKGIPAKYGGFETFVEKLTEYRVEKNIQYHVACMTENSAKSGITDKHFEHNGAKCFNIDIPNIGPAKAVYYDILSIKCAIQMAQKNQDKNPIFYVLASRVGPFISGIKKKIDALNGRLFINPDGHEWMREKWSYPIQRYWKFSEKLMVKHADLVICDSKTIEDYIRVEYKLFDPKTIYIAYGTDLKKSNFTEKSTDVVTWYQEKKISPYNYYLVVGRFVPENNYEVMIREFMKSKSRKDLILITNVEKNKYFNKLRKETKFNLDSRIKFVGTVYNQELLKYIRENAFAYLHGHEVGGTNPSLLEALASTSLNLLLNVGFNSEVARKDAFYWDKKSNCLANLIDEIETNEKFYFDFGQEPSKQIEDRYTWELIVNKYEIVFMK